MQVRKTKRTMEEVRAYGEGDRVGNSSVARTLCVDQAFGGCNRPLH